jgi:PilZ domain
MNPEPNRRQYLRHPAQFSAKYTVRQGTFRDLVRDICASGLFVSSRRKIEQGQPIEFQFPVFAFKRRLRVMGKVVRCHPSGFAVVFDQPIDAGIFETARFQESAIPRPPKINAPLTKTDGREEPLRPGN